MRRDRQSATRPRGVAEEERRHFGVCLAAPDPASPVLPKAASKACFFKGFHGRHAGWARPVGSEQLERDVMRIIGIVLELDAAPDSPEGASVIAGRSPAARFASDAPPLPHAPRVRARAATAMSRVTRKVGESLLAEMRQLGSFARCRRHATWAQCWWFLSTLAHIRQSACRRRCAWRDRCPVSRTSARR